MPCPVDKREEKRSLVVVGGSDSVSIHTLKFFLNYGVLGTGCWVVLTG